jgi:hypothetical protein
MPKGPRGEKRPADTVSAAIKVARIATGEIEDERHAMPGRAKAGKAGGKARAKRLTDKARKAIAKKASSARWSSQTVKS